MRNNANCYMFEELVFVHIYVYLYIKFHGCAEIPDLFRVLNMISRE